MTTSTMQAHNHIFPSSPVNTTIMAPSLLTPLSPRPRHGRGKSGSITRARAHSLTTTTTDDRPILISRALTWILRRGLLPSEKRAEMGIEIVFDEEGWANCADVLQWPNLAHLIPTLTDLHQILATQPRPRFTLRLADTTLDPTLPTSHLIRATTSPAFPIPQVLGARMTLDSDNNSEIKHRIPELAVYGTTYATYARVIASGQLRNMGGGNITLAALTTDFFTSVPVSEESDVSSPLATSPTTPNATTTIIGAEAEVLFYIDVHALLAVSGLVLHISANGDMLTVADGAAVPASCWKRIVGRKGVVGTLWEDGREVREVPLGIRGKKAGGCGRELKGRNGVGRKGGKNGRASWSGGEDGSE